jgi:hypothetical protein
MFRFANYLRYVCLAAQRAPVAAVIYTGICFLMPWAMQFVLHPSDMVRFVRLFISWPSATVLVGEVAALGGLLGLGLLQLSALVAIYRRSQLPVPLWPTVALVVIGFAANGGWWIYSGFFDLGGALCGLAPLASSWLCEGKALDFAFRPSGQPAEYGG